MSEVKEIRKNMLDMAGGAIKERVEYAMGDIIDNIMDLNTSPNKKRSLNLVIEFTPDSERKNIQTRITIKTKLEPTNPIMTALYVGADMTTGEIGVVELVPQIPGQRNIFSNDEAPQVGVLKILKNA